MPSEIELLATISNSSLSKEEKDEFRKRLINEGATEDYVQDVLNACGNLYSAGVSGAKPASSAKSSAKPVVKAPPKAPPKPPSMSPFKSFFILFVLAAAVLAGLWAFDLIAFKPEFPFIEDVYTASGR